MQRWKVLTAVFVALVLAGVGGYVGFRSAQPQAIDAPRAPATVAVTRGRVQQTVVAPGRTVGTREVVLGMTVEGRLSEVSVRPGTRAKAGDVLVRLDAKPLEEVLDLAQLRYSRAETEQERQVSQAEMDLRHAENLLRLAVEPTPLEIAQAEAAVAGASLSLKEALDALDELLNPKAVDLAQAEAVVADYRVELDDARKGLNKMVSPDEIDVERAESDVADARVALDDAKKGLDKLVNPDEIDVARAESDVAEARVTLDDAGKTRDALLNPKDVDLAQAEASVVDAGLAVQEALKDWPSDVDLAKVLAGVNSASTAVGNAHRDLELAQKMWDEETELARKALADPLKEYKAVFKKWLGIDLNEAEAGLAPDALLETWAIDLTSLFHADNRSSDLGWTLRPVRFPSDDPVTRWDETVVFAWTNFFPGILLATCENQTTKIETSCVKREIDGAWEAHRKVRGGLETIKVQAATAVAEAEDVISRAELELIDAQVALAEVQAAGGPLQVESRAKRLALAQATREQAETDLAKLTNGYDPHELTAREKQIALASANLEQAETDLAKLTDGPDPAEVAAKRKQAALAEASLEQAETDLAKLTDGPDPAEVAAKRKQVALAEASLEQAEKDLAELMNGPDAVDMEAGQKRVAEVRAKLSEAEEELSRLREGFERPQALQSEDKLTPAVVDIAALGAEVERARIALEGLQGGVDPLLVKEVEIARSDLAAAVLIAPFDGVVLEVMVRPGEVVGPGMGLILLADPSALEVRTTVIEEDLPLVQVGQPVELFFDAQPDAAVAGQVARIVTRRVRGEDRPLYHVYVAVDGIPKGVVSGMTADASIVVAQNPDGLRLSRAVLRARSGGTARVKVWADGRVEDRTVKIGLRGDVNVEILEGLRQGELVFAE